MNFSRGYRFFLKLAVVYLVVSTLLPYATTSAGLLLFPLYPAGYEGPFFSRSYRTWGFYWSFVYVWENVPDSTLLPPSMVLPPDPALLGLRLGLFPEYWGWGTPLPRLILPLQLALMLLGFFTLKRAKRALSIVPFFLGMLSLSVLCFFTATLDFTSPSYGFWIVNLSAIFTSIALARAKKWI